MSGMRKAPWLEATGLIVGGVLDEPRFRLGGVTSVLFDGV